MITSASLRLTLTANIINIYSSHWLVVAHPTDHEYGVIRMESRKKGREKNYQHAKNKQPRPYSFLCLHPLYKLLSIRKESLWSKQPAKVQVHDARIHFGKMQITARQLQHFKGIFQNGEVIYLPE